MHVVRFDGPVSTDGSHEEISQRWLAILEARIREHPEQWMWMHRRWRDLAPVLL
jgi:lauroyl/myristoyl acyltransferase